MNLVVDIWSYSELKISQDAVTYFSNISETVSFSCVLDKYKCLRYNTFFNLTISQTFDMKYKK